jgi:diguanylate cyclase (GGDEF)-like protein/PAS domain S-box-containing protein
MLITPAILAVLSGSLPGTASWPLILAAALLCLVSPHFARIEQGLHHASWLRYPLMLMAIVVPMALFGLAILLWSLQPGGVETDLVVNACIIQMLVATALLDGRTTSILGATIGLWSSSTFVLGSFEASLLLVMGGCLGCGLAIRQGRLSRAEAEQRAEREKERRRAEELLSEYEQTGQGWFWETDRRGAITYISPRIAKLLRKTPEELAGQPFTGLFVLDGQQQESERTLVFHLSTRSSFQDLTVRAATDEQDERWWSITGRPTLDQFNNFMGFRGSGSDLTETRRSQQHATQLARFDSLTKLANRFQMAEWMDKLLNSPRIENRGCAVFLLDLDRFKQVNDTMGHPAGDALLIQVADRLRMTIGNLGRVGRLGGDEFQILLPGRHQREGLGQLARRIIDCLSQPYSINGNQVVIGASVGISTCPDDGVTSEEIIRNADLALYAAKGSGRGRHHFYDNDLHNDAQERQRLEQDLREAIAKGSLELHYQPQVHTTSEQITGFEALLRWNHPRHGYISPDRFVPIAEETGLVAQIGEWALRTACRQLADWPEQVRIAVNVSPLQFANPALPAIVTGAIASAGISPSRLELEITESVFLSDDRSTEAMFNALKRIGVRLALDDFGTGYSSLGYLKKAPFDKIKIDQSFVRGATVPGSRNGAIISSIVSLAEALGMETTAEGVETFDELDLVRELGCSHVQGFIYERGLASEAVSRLLEGGFTAVAKGPRSARAPRQTMLRKVIVEHEANHYHGTIRNVSRGGAMIEGLWNVPVGTRFSVHLAEGYVVSAEARWAEDDRMGVEFARPLAVDDRGAILFTPPSPDREAVRQAVLRKAG